MWKLRALHTNFLVILKGDSVRIWSGNSEHLFDWFWKKALSIINGNWPRAQQTNFPMILKGIPSGFHVEVVSSSDRFPIDFEDTPQELHMKIDSELSGPISYEFWHGFLKDIRWELPTTFQLILKGPPQGFHMEIVLEISWPISHSFWKWAF